MSENLRQLDKIYQAKIARAELLEKQKLHRLAELAFEEAEIARQRFLRAKQIETVTNVMSK